MWVVLQVEPIHANEEFHVARVELFRQPTQDIGPQTTFVSAPGSCRKQRQYLLSQLKEALPALFQASRVSLVHTMEQIGMFIIALNELI
jgi:hypothetical protein